MPKLDPGLSSKNFTGFGKWGMRRNVIWSCLQQWHQHLVIECLSKKKKSQQNQAIQSLLFNWLLAEGKPTKNFFSYDMFLFHHHVN